MGRNKNKNKNKQQRMKKKNEQLLTALIPTSTATSTKASAKTPTPTSGDANDDGTIATTTLVCYHGSAEKHFFKGSEYKIVVDEWISVLKKGRTTESLILKQNFAKKHKNLLEDSDFFRYIFAYTTNMFRKCYKTEKYSPSFKRKLQRTLHLGIYSKYRHSPLSADTEKREKYNRDIQTDRGIINCLYRETNTFCHCMKPYKIEAIGMEKLGRCRGCREEFQKMKLRRCSGCEKVQYCSTKCEKEDWPKHKNYCIKSVEGFGKQHKLVLAAVFLVGGGLAFDYYTNHYVSTATTATVVPRIMVRKSADEISDCFFSSHK